MQLLNPILALALVSSVASVRFLLPSDRHILIPLPQQQVIVTVTNTVTVITVTMTPSWTSTSTKFTTVNGSAPPPGSTSTVIVTYTASAPRPTGTNCPGTIPQWDQCGGQGYSGSCAGDCGPNSVCKYKDGKIKNQMELAMLIMCSVWYSYCSDLPKVKHVVNTVYAG